VSKLRPEAPQAPFICFAAASIYDFCAELCNHEEFPDSDILHQSPLTADPQSYTE
jgi:hypothetical protein